MTEMQTDDGERLRMPVKWWSLQLLRMRLFWSLSVAVILTRHLHGEQLLWSGTIVAVAVFVPLTVYALIERRRWTREQEAEADYAGTDQNP